MAASYNKPLHIMIERVITNTKLMQDASISANIITKIKTGKYIVLDKVESICVALDVTPNDILEFIQPEDEKNA